MGNVVATERYCDAGVVGETGFLRVTGLYMPEHKCAHVIMRVTVEVLADDVDDATVIALLEDHSNTPG